MGSLCVIDSVRFMMLPWESSDAASLLCQREYPLHFSALKANSATKVRRFIRQVDEASKWELRIGLPSSPVRSDDV